ncbi:hypothetical protein ACLB2K_034108 [Fragaria x ananassa]
MALHQVLASPAQTLNVAFDVKPRPANYAPCIWGDHFLSYSSMKVDVKLKQRVQELKEEVKRMLLAAVNEPASHMMVTFTLLLSIFDCLDNKAIYNVSCATFRILQEPIYNLPELISMIAQTKVSVDRIKEFVKEDQLKLIPSHTPKQSNVMIVIETGEYAWKTSDQNLKNPTIKIVEKIETIKGYKVAICGSVGSGKSSLLSSILGEIPKISGVGAKVYGTKAYVPQSSWIQSGTVRENVLFGKEMIEGYYGDVLEGCALDQDVKMWEDGDLTVVGERGMNLSGGQKQRIQLARAVYSDSDVYILDDPFSAVDAHTGTHLFKKCLLQHLSLKTVIYATHQLEFLEAADLILVIKGGQIAQSGKYEDLIADLNGELVRQMAAHRKSLDQVNRCQVDDSLKCRPHQVNLIEVVEEKRPFNNGKLPEKSHEEEAETGPVTLSVYSTFVTSAYGGALVPVILLCQVLFQGLQMGSNYWMAWGTEKEVFRAPISFFDITPSSRILNRSSTDQSTVDMDIPYRLAGLAFALIQLISIIVLMSQVAWQVFLLFLGVLGLSIWYQAYYITTARELARMVGIRKAPILHHFSESITGAATIR